MKSFSFITADKILFGNGEFKNIGAITKDFGDSCLIICSKSIIQNDIIVDAKKALNLSGVIVKINIIPSGEPTTNTVMRAVINAKEFAPDVVIGLGGGSVVDTAKAVCGLINNPGDVTDYMDGVGSGLIMENEPVPFIAIPTTSGTGAEVTKNAVISAVDRGLKRSFRDERLLANLVIVDPILTLNVPKKTTAYAGMDALTQLIESYVSKKSNEFTDSLTIPAIKRCINALPKAFYDGSNLSAREDMAYCSMISGLCLANSGLGAAHGIAAALGAVLQIPHGLACAILLPHVIGINASHMGEKVFALANVLTDKNFVNSEKAADACIMAINELADKLNIPKDLKEFNISKDSIEKLVDCCSSSSMSGNPYAISEEETFNLIKKLI